MSTQATASTPSESAPSLRFDRREWSGAFGDLGTDLPLLAGMILAAQLDATSVLTVFGLMQIATAVLYRMPMPVQPLKAMAAIVISQKVAPEVLYGGGLAIGVSMLVLTATGFIDFINRVVSKPVVRGIQSGLGLQLAAIALKEYLSSEGARGVALAGVGFFLTLFLLGRRRIPAALILVALGAAYGAFWKLDLAALPASVAFRLPQLQAPKLADVWTGFLLLALPQIPLSICNSILATRQIAEDLFPQRRITARGIAWTYSAMNLINPFFGGVPTCHGSGGLAGHYAFGGRTGGSVIIYGALFACLGLFFGPGFQAWVNAFPLPLLGVLLIFESLSLLALLRDLAPDQTNFRIALLVGLIASSIPYGYLVGLLVGMLCVFLTSQGWTALSSQHPEGR
ncbi:MAG: putative sulfate/molybdate transporter [Bryobacteraceae bacterium]|nr:putative sulfate/molybdate transporter [Bryobacteraceae bacterium]MDW8378816.1 putative sulfate/molybdate transporter [Bryobacterales bacterium]